MKVLKIKVLPHANEDFLPCYATEGSAGLDLCAAINSDVVINPGERALIPAGISLELEIGYEAQVRPRSGLALKHGITVLNTPGTIDSDYRGEVGVILINLGKDSFVVSRGMRIAQMVIAKHESPLIEVVVNLSETERGHGGFGSTGVKELDKVHV